MKEKIIETLLEYAVDYNDECPFDYDERLNCGGDCILEGIYSISCDKKRCWKEYANLSANDLLDFKEEYIQYCIDHDEFNEYVNNLYRNRS